MDGIGFEQATAVRTVSDGRLTAEVVPGWDVRGNPHGGYLLALVTRAIGTVVAQPDPISVSATYLAPPRFGPAQLDVAVVRAGGRQSTATARLSQDGVVRLDVVATFGTLGDERPQLYGADPVAPAIPPADACLPRDALDGAEGEPIALHERLALRFHPDTGWLHGRPRGHPELHGWLRLAEEQAAGNLPADLYAVLLFSDGMPPSLFEAEGRRTVHTPTVQLTTHVFARPSSSWLQGRFRTRVRTASFLDEDGDLWDEAGTLVATTRQLALLRTLPPAS